MGAQIGRILQKILLFQLMHEVYTLQLYVKLRCQTKICPEWVTLCSLLFKIRLHLFIIIHYIWPITLGQLIILHLQISVYGILFCKPIALLIVFISMKLNAIYTSGGQVMEEIAGAADCLILIFVKSTILTQQIAQGIGKWEKWLVFTQLCRQREKRSIICY